VLVALVSYLPVPGHMGEMKTKPTQYAVQTINAAGIQPNFILARSDKPVDDVRRRKLSVFCNVAEQDVVASPDVGSIYELPLLFERAGFAKRILKKLGLKPKQRNGKAWAAMVRRISGAKKSVKIGVIGKYFASGAFTLSDAYISVIESLKHAAWSQGAAPKLEWLNAEEYEKDPKALKSLSKYDGILVPGGFGSRGIEGKIAAIKYAREKKIPYFGLCYGMQLAVIEFARHVAGLKEANTPEVDAKTKHPVVHIMPDQEKKLAQKQYGNTMRLGAYDCMLAPGTLSRAAYGSAKVSERHRHRYEVNNAYRERLREAGLTFAGTSPDGLLVEIVEIKDHPFFVGVQFHPEFQSRPLRPHPLFSAFVKAALAKK